MLRHHKPPATSCGGAMALGWIALVLAIAACAPALDWRELRPDQVGVVALFPCKTVRAARRVELAGRPVELTLHRCDAGGATWALAHAEVGDPSHVGPILRALHDSTLANLGGAKAEPLAGRVAGQTPQDSAGYWQLQGRLPDGQRLQARMALFSKGTRVFQATALGTALNRDAADTFFDALRLPA